MREEEQEEEQEEEVEEEEEVIGVRNSTAQHGRVQHSLSLSHQLTRPLLYSYRRYQRQTRSGQIVSCRAGSD